MPILTVQCSERFLAGKAVSPSDGASYIARYEHDSSRDKTRVQGQPLHVVHSIIPGVSDRGIAFCGFHREMN